MDASTLCFIMMLDALPGKGPCCPVRQGCMGIGEDKYLFSKCHIYYRKSDKVFYNVTSMTHSHVVLIAKVTSWYSVRYPEDVLTSLSWLVKVCLKDFRFNRGDSMARVYPLHSLLQY